MVAGDDAGKAMCELKKKEEEDDERREKRIYIYIKKNLKKC